MTCTPAMRRYNRRVFVLSLIYGIALVSVTYAFEYHLLRGVLAYVGAALPALPIVGIFAAIGFYFVDEQDEYMRMLKVRQTLWASGLALSVATIWGFLESFRLVHHIEAYYVAVLWFVALALSALADRFGIGKGA